MRHAGRAMSVCRVFFVAASVGRYKDVLGEWDVMVQDQTKETRRVQDELGDAYTMPIRMYGVVEESIVDGPGLRFSVFVQGCSHHCPGCHNQESQPHRGGYLSTVGELCERIAGSTSISGVTLTGGEPFEQPEACLAIARWCKARGLSVWVYSGYVYEDIVAGKVANRALSSVAACGGLDCARRDFQPTQKEDGASACEADSAYHAVRALLDVCDVLVDGPFVLAKRSYDLRWKGSSNQRVIELGKTRRNGCVSLWWDQDEAAVFSVPENW